MSEAIRPRDPVERTATLHRLEALAASGIRSDADVAWFVGPNGFLRCCRIEARGVEIAVSNADLDDLMDEIDDHLSSVGETTASDRARALRAVANADTPAAVEAAGLLLARSLVGPEPSPAMDALVDAAITDVHRLIGLAPGEGRPAPEDGLERRLAVPIAVSTHARGELVRLDLRRRPGPASVAPDMEEAPFQRYDPDFLHAIVDAHRAAGGSHGAWRFSVHSMRTGLPLDAVTGRSVGLGAAVGLSLLDPGRRSPSGLDPRWVLTGDVLPDGTVRSLLGQSNKTAYRNKIAAARNLTVLLPSADVPEVASLAGDTECELLGVDSLEHALDLVERHHRGSTAYQRQMKAPPSRLGRWAVLAFVVTLMLAVALGIRVWFDDDAAADAAATIRRENPPLTIEPFASATFPVGTTLQFSRTEVTNFAYRACVAHRICRQPRGRQARPMDDVLNERYPVTGVTASDAEVFCHWVYGDEWGLPTFDQFRAAVAQNYRQFPFGDLGNPALVDPPQGLPVDRLAPVDDPAVDGRELAWLTGNAAEWTRTQCSADGVCANVRSTVGSVLQGLRVFGISFLDADRPVPADWLSSTASGEHTLLADQGVNWVGFRCASEERHDGGE